MKQGVTKKEFVTQLEKLLRMTRVGVERLILDEPAHADYITIIYGNGNTQKVNVTGDSGIGIILDVAEKVF